MAEKEMAKLVVDAAIEVHSLEARGCSKQSTKRRLPSRLVSVRQGIHRVADVVQE
ncbi:hypothetical protein WME75_36015 [Sorangium sp. So ce1014]|uniref:hypothetical protein n=1 Tax=Sorangium sp. So ce1014 TaxID=3133326 RepID=UPI003F62B3EF